MREAVALHDEDVNGTDLAQSAALNGEEQRGEFRIRDDEETGYQVDVTNGNKYPSSLNLKEVRGSGRRSHFRYVRTPNGGMHDTLLQKAVFPVPESDGGWLCRRFR